MEKNTEFKPPRHWVALEELSAEYWSNEAEQTRRGQEFYDKPIEVLERIEKMDKSGVTRREFLTVMGASMAMASFACAKRPVNKIIPYVVQPQEVTPGIPVYYASTCQDCAKNCGILVKTREGRPIKLEGNDLHPSNKGTLCAQGQASVLGLYDPERLKGPGKGAKGSAKNPIAWSEVDAFVASALKESSKVRLLTFPKSGESTRRLVKEFLANFPDSKWIEADPVGMDTVADGQNESYGTRVVPTYAFDQAEVVLSFAADFLGTWGDSVAHANQWAKKRKLQKTTSINTEEMSRLWVFESMLTITGANADERIPVVPGAELAVALAVAHELIVAQKKTKFAGMPEVVSMLSSSNVDDLLGKAGGLSREKIKKLTEELWAARGKSLVVGSGSVGLQSVINLLNSALENDGKTIDGTQDPVPYSGSTKLLANLQSEMEHGLVDLLIIDQSNPVYFLPEGGKFSSAMAKVKSVVFVGSSVNETSKFADVVAAENHFLESWGDAHPRASVYSLQQPTLSPIADTKSFEDLLIQWSRLSGKFSGLLTTVAGNPKGTFYDYLKENWKQSLYAAHGKGQSANEFWETTLQKGVLEVKLPAPRERAFKSPSLKFAQTELSKLKTVSVAQSKKGPVTEGTGIVLGLYEKISMGDGRHANNAWLQEMPDPISTVTWDNYANISPEFAKQLELSEGDIVVLKGETGSIELPVKLQPGLVKGVVTAALGYGRTAAGAVGNGVGSNAFQLAGFNSQDGFVFEGQSVSITKTGKKYELAATQTHHRTAVDSKSLARPIVNDITLEEYKKNPHAASETEPHIRPEKAPGSNEVASLWTPPVDYAKSPHRWMMGIDLNSCTGCGACVIACQAENNIPIVGRDGVRMSREMHWVRIDRYYSGDENNPEVVFQPMMCQHCENAPCETVCPVVATSHSEDGLNQMTYSRCVGTRYCQNNCPYKVRRFNFFDHWKNYKDTLNMVWNPEVTVRQRGIMEKCTFCVQRINEARGHAKDKNPTVRNPLVKDAELKTACQQTCPTEAIVFGNVNDPESRISALRKHPRAFRVLEILNTVPSIHYLTKVRNHEGEGESNSINHSNNREGAENGHHS